MQIDIDKIRNDFPILNLKVNNKPYVYFDNAATTQKPVSVVKALENYYYTMNSNVHRGDYYFSKLSTIAFENAREYIRSFLNARSVNEIIFTRGTTESINLVANSFGRKFISGGDEIIISTLEHHSNIVPWQFVSEERGALIKVIPINDEGEIIFEEFEKLLSPKTKIVAITHISNALGIINPIKKIIEKAHQLNIPVLIDGAQSIAHTIIDVQALDCDFFCFSGHKIYGPTGIGILYGRQELLEQMPPYQGGGEMISRVTFEKTTYNDLPYKFEAGTPDISGAIILPEALKYISKLGLGNISTYEHELLTYATEKLLTIEGLRIIGTSKNKSCIISFIIEGIHPLDIGTLLDKMNVAVRIGHQCTQPLMTRFNITHTIRISLAFYNTIQEIDYFIQQLLKAISMLK